MTNEDPTASYPATATHTELGGAELTGNLWLQSHALLFESAAANCGIPLERLEVQEDQSGGVLFTDRDKPEWCIRTAELRVLHHPIIQSRNHLRTQAQAIRRAAENRRQLRL